MKKMVLFDNHPAKQKFDKLCDIATEMGIRLEYMNGRTFVTIDEQKFELEDIEHRNQDLGEFPPSLEFKLTYEKP